MSQADITYCELLKTLNEKILTETTSRANRTATDTVAIFGHQMRFDLSKEFPLLTTKQVHFPSIVSELLWFLKGDTNIKYLLAHNNHIWTDWRYEQYCKNLAKFRPMERVLTKKEFEERIVEYPDFARTWGDIGKGYGHQWRNFSEDATPQVYYDDKDKVGKWKSRIEGFDQISWVINEIKTNPNSRRLIVTGWNPHEVNQVDLPPCHTLFQFFIDNGKLSCQLYQRSADVFLGVPFNIASYALLTHLIAKECGLDVGEFVWVGGDTHLYLDHYRPSSIQLDNLLEGNTYDAPELVIDWDPKEKSIFDLEPRDIYVNNYQHAGKIPAPVAV